MNEMIEASGVSLTPTTIDEITRNVLQTKREAQQAAIYYSVKLGRQLTEAKALLPHGAWGDWLRDKVDFSQRQAENFMKIYEAYGDEQPSLFGGSNSQAFEKLNITQLLLLTAVPEDERADFAEQNDVESMSTRDLEQLIRERDDANRRADQAQRAAAELEETKKRLEAAMAEAQKAAENAAAANEKIEKEKEKAKKLKEKLDDAVKNPKITDELLAEIKDGAKAEAEKAAAAQQEKALRELKEKAEAAELAKAEAEKNLAASQADFEEARKKLAAANPDVAAVKVLFENAQTALKKLAERIDAITDGETKAKMTAALKALLTSMMPEKEE